MTWTELVMDSASIQGDQPAVKDVRTGEALSYTAFRRRVTKAAAGLRRHGLRIGRRVIVDLPFGAVLPVAVHAVAWAGGVAVLRSTGPADMMITRGPAEPPKAEVRKVFAVRPFPGALPFAGLIGEATLEFGPLAGPALSVDGERVLDHAELTTDLRKVAARLVIAKDDVVLAAVGDPFTGLRVLDLAMLAGARVVIAHEPSLVGCRVLAQEHRATMVVAPYDLARRLLGDPTLRVIDERAVVSSLAL
ncbi:AMP-binding protein [Nonomuraea sp. NN258]|uniref:AMP-binding protein n=1 Tax=Nonomuraea antri TaxID=2730852 RepID=UPI00156A423B|nr:AMP-binding protein [Nonomuraea antri]NRQ33294.1 AMP-binding protein [Nonomuraea antri]